MDRSNIRHYVARTRALVESAPPGTRAETRTWIVEPLLETLGWDLRADAHRSEVTIADVRLEYVLSIDRTPALFVAVDPFTESCSTDRERELRSAMEATGVDRAMYTNGRTIVLLAGVETSSGTSTIDRFDFPLTSMVDAVDTLERVSRSRLHHRLECHSRAITARRLAIERDELTSTIVDELAALVGGTYRPELETATERFLDELVDGFGFWPRSDDPSAPGEASSLSDPISSSTDLTADDSSGKRSRGGYADTDAASQSGDERGRADSDVNSTTSTDTDSSADRDAHTDSSPSSPSATADRPTHTDSRTADPTTSHDGESEDRIEDDDGAGTAGEECEDENADGNETEAETTGEYVVRFFNDRGSIGAIGHSRPDGAMVHAAEFLFEHGLSGIRVPWQSDPHPDSDQVDSDASGDDPPVTVLNSEPVLADDSPMAQYEALSNGYYLNTSGTADQLATRLEGLAERAGLRVMFTGDWPSAQEG